ncbi:MAG: helix-turn-helix transcriptional regulator [Myxococcota bacterium]
MSLIRLPQVLALTGLSKTTLHRFEAAGRFPKRYRIGDRAVAWNSEEVELWLRSREHVAVRCADAPGTVAAVQS